MIRTAGRHSERCAESVATIWRYGRLASIVTNPSQSGIDNSAEDFSPCRTDREAASVHPLISGHPPSHERAKPSKATTGGAVDGLPERRGIPARILVAGSDLLAGAIAGALEVHGFTTRSMLPREPEIQGGIAWSPTLVLLDVRSLDLASGTALIERMRREGLRSCVIDVAGDEDRLNAWAEAGSSALIDGGEPFDELCRTIIRLLRRGSLERPARRSPFSLQPAQAVERPRDPQLSKFSVLTERERVVLAELMEGHCAEEIATSSFVSISTVRSQIKSILQKLGVNSQLAAVALARRVDWSLDCPTEDPSTGYSSNPPSNRRTQAF
jgi:two-component system nitrate/nitrite response regulator NarL